MASSQLNPPKNFIVYGGVQPTAEEDATGAVYWAVCGRYGKNGWFGMFVFRQVGNEAATQVQFSPELPGQGSLNAQGYVTGTTSSNQAWRVQVPGFIPRSAGSSGPVQVIPAPAPVAVDSEARAAAQAALSKAQEAENIARSAYSKAVSALSQVGQVSQDALSRMGDIAWGKAADRIYAELQNSNSPLVSFIWQKSKDAAYSLLKERGMVK